MFRVLRPNVTLLRRITLYPRYIQSLSERRFELKKDIDNLDEHVALTNFKQWLSSRFLAPSTALNATSLPVRPLLRSVLSTFLLHYNSRVASLCGHGYYTIGPCGEESLASAALALDNDKDTAALHYRHLGISFLRNWSTKSGGKYDDDTYRELLLDRARGYTVSSLDPVSSGNHCCLGGGELDFLVTSTLASQCPPAVGRALGNTLNYSLAGTEGDRKFDKKSIHYVSLGDGSTSNAHFLAALNLARYAGHRSFKCPVVFGVSDNQVSISLPNYGYLDALLESGGVRKFRADGNDLESVYKATKDAVDYSRRNQKPSVVVYSGLRRRFGHAATDRENAYLTSGEIRSHREADNLERAVEWGVGTGEVGYEEVLGWVEEMEGGVREAFDKASGEPKVAERDEVMRQAMRPEVPTPRVLPFPQSPSSPTVGTAPGRRDVMRKSMNKAIAESLDERPNLVYIGEDVQHGGYYLVTDGLHRKYPKRVCDFPPDETTLVGAGMGYSQAGLLPVVEIPYAKYLDCGYDMFEEAGVMNWLSGGRGKGMGMVIRLQGFDRGTFGGNFHTHNQLHMPPGITTVCYSNGEDYARGYRNAIRQAEGGRITMLVDCTALLNLRHLTGKDRGWERAFPEKDEVLSFHDVRRYGDEKGRGEVAIVTYGNGVVTGLQAREEFSDPSKIDVIDCMLLSECPDGLVEELACYDKIVFADICKEGQNPLSGMLGRLNEGVENGGAGLGGKKWCFRAAQRTYNPLGTTLTFLNVKDVLGGIEEVM